MTLSGFCLFFLSRHHPHSCRFSCMSQLLSCYFLCSLFSNILSFQRFWAVYGMRSLTAVFCEREGCVVSSSPLGENERDGGRCIFWVSGFLYLLSRLHGGWYGARMGEGLGYHGAMNIGRESRVGMGIPGGNIWDGIAGAREGMM